MSFVNYSEIVSILSKEDIDKIKKNMKKLNRFAKRIGEDAGNRIDWQIKWLLISNNKKEIRNGLQDK